MIIIVAIAEDEDEVAFGGDADGEFGGWFGDSVVFFFEEFFGAGFAIGEVVESVLFGVFVGRGIIDVDIVVIILLKGGLFGGGEAGSVGAVKYEDGSIFIALGVATEHLGYVGLDVGVIIGTTSWNNVRDTTDVGCSHEFFWLDEGDLADVIEI